MIKVDLKKSKIDQVTVKFRYKIFYMDYLIHIRKTGTAAEFATKVGVARSTFFEYMDYMRNELNIVILYDRSAKTYYYSNKGLYDSLKQWIA